jgi:hypothetical protein
MKSAAMPPVRAVLLSAATLMILHGQIAHAGASTRFEILSLQLGMTASEVLQQLHVQGINGTPIEQRRPARAPTPTTPCISTIDARTRDGRLRISLAGTNPDAPIGQEIVFRITYRITCRGPADADAMHEAAIGWYGRPSSVTTDTWCGRLDVTTGTCAAGQPILRIQAVPDAAALLTLSGD